MKNVGWPQFSSEFLKNIFLKLFYISYIIFLLLYCFIFHFFILKKLRKIMQTYNSKANNYKSII
jgi:hypothetical protein